MRNFTTYVLLRQEAVGTNAWTEPCETGWATEAIFFVKIHALSSEKVPISARAQISVDGINWIDDGGALFMETKGDYCLKLREFGGWLRLALACPDGAGFTATVQLALKE